jgi:hypothetical protein
MPVVLTPAETLAIVKSHIYSIADMTPGESIDPDGAYACCFIKALSILTRCANLIGQHVELMAKVPSDNG